MTARQLSAADERQLADRGISVSEANRQLELLRHPPGFLEVLRPCTVGDGIRRLSSDELPALQADHAAAAAAGRIVKFVPASGAATRMFKDLHSFHRGPGREQSWMEVLNAAQTGDGPAAALATFLREIERLPFYEDLRGDLERRGEEIDGLARVGAFQPILDALLDADGLGYDRRPKGLLKFHRHPAGARTAFEEHLVEAASYARDAGATCRLHLTVSPEALERFERRFAEVGRALGEALGAAFELSYSTQKPSTDTLAIDPAGAVARDDQGRLRLRPGGHGSLIENLDELQADIVFVKNIDNVQPDRTKPVTIRWKTALAGLLVQLQRRCFDYLDRLREPDPSAALLDEALGFARRELRVDPVETGEPATYQCTRAALIRRLNRPLRVCGVVPNTGEPGGGPFWVRDRDGGSSLQIVESAQVDPDDEEQQRIWRSSTHFNPVDLVCGVRDATGTPFDLSSFLDPDAVIVTRKTAAGREMRVLERPGLWNGAMADWNTVFVEVPIETFSPVKTVLDLLRDEHQG